MRNLAITRKKVPPACLFLFKISYIGGDGMGLPMRKPNGAYFIPVRAKERHEILWNVGATFGRPQESCNVGSASGRPQNPPQFSEYGKIIQNEIERIGEIYDHIAAGGRRATRGRPYSFAHYPAV